MAAPTQELPAWLSLATLTFPGPTPRVSTGLVQLPLEYSGPSIPLVWPYVAAASMPANGNQLVSFLDGGPLLTVNGGMVVTRTATAPPLSSPASVSTATPPSQSGSVSSISTIAAASSAAPSVTAPASSMSSLAPGPQPTINSAASNQSALATSQIIGIVIGSVVIAILILLALFWVFLRRRRRRWINSESSRTSSLQEWEDVGHSTSGRGGSVRPWARNGGNGRGAYNAPEGMGFVSGATPAIATRSFRDLHESLSSVNPVEAWRSSVIHGPPGSVRDNEDTGLLTYSDRPPHRYTDKEPYDPDATNMSFGRSSSSRSLGLGLGLPSAVIAAAFGGAAAGSSVRRRTPPSSRISPKVTDLDSSRITRTSHQSSLGQDVNPDAPFFALSPSPPHATLGTASLGDEPTSRSSRGGLVPFPGSWQNDVTASSGSEDRVVYRGLEVGGLAAAMTSHSDYDSREQTTSYGNISHAVEGGSTPGTRSEDLRPQDLFYVAPSSARATAAIATPQSPYLDSPPAYVSSTYPALAADGTPRTSPQASRSELRSHDDRIHDSPVSRMETRSSSYHTSPDAPTLGMPPIAGALVGARGSRHTVSTDPWSPDPSTSKQPQMMSPTSTHSEFGQGSPSTLDGTKSTRKVSRWSQSSAGETSMPRRASSALFGGVLAGLGLGGWFGNKGRESLASIRDDDQEMIQSTSLSTLPRLRSTPAHTTSAQLDADSPDPNSINPNTVYDAHRSPLGQLERIAEFDEAGRKDETHHVAVPLLRDDDEDHRRQGHNSESEEEVDEDSSLLRSARLSRGTMGQRILQFEVSSQTASIHGSRSASASHSSHSISHQTTRSSRRSASDSGLGSFISSRLSLRYGSGIGSESSGHGRRQRRVVGGARVGSFGQSSSSGHGHQHSSSVSVDQSSRRTGNSSEPVPPRRLNEGDIEDDGIPPDLPQRTGPELTVPPFLRM